MYHFVIESFQRLNFEKKQFCILCLYLTSDFEYLWGISQMSVETDEASKVTVLFVVSEATTSYKKLQFLNISSMPIFQILGEFWTEHVVQ